jgi:[CysO sulfur-carrier protein]-S-L-cysteine hydrolase
VKIPLAAWHEMVAHCLDGLPDEACGLLAGPVEPDGRPSGSVEAVYACRNADASARTYTIDSQDQLRAMRDAARRDLDIVGVYHSHTHTDAYPSATDVRQAVDPNWWYVIVGLRHGEPDVRAWLIADGAVREERIDMSSEPGP